MRRFGSSPTTATSPLSGFQIQSSTSGSSLSETCFVSDLAQAHAKLKDISGDLDTGLHAAALDVLDAEFCSRV
jgi:hypothetical protein